ncbi:MAG: hypothetical protein AB7P21_19260 [Lautropia sp.]
MTTRITRLAGAAVAAILSVAASSALAEDGKWVPFRKHDSPSTWYITPDVGKTTDGKSYTSESSARNAANQANRAERKADREARKAERKDRREK